VVSAMQRTEGSGPAAERWGTDGRLVPREIDPQEGLVVGASESASGSGSVSGSRIGRGDERVGRKIHLGKA